MADREFTNINGIKVCDQTARDSIPTKTSQLENDSDYATITQVNQAIDNAQLGGGEVDLSGYVTKETGNANQITFADGQTFQTKLDAGTLKGEKGDKGDQGPKGDKGDKGDTGEQGPKGDKGDIGEQGPAGANGQDGLTTSISVNGTTYTHVNGVITLPNYPSIQEAKDYIDLKLDNKSIKVLTQAEYDALTEIDDNVIYIISDKTSSGESSLGFKVLSSEDASITDAAI